ncbi:hypothetical protein R3P38DRAFT_3276769 [Favolaschia claudopus]|uniref:Type-1 angiotensin II receptor-associated protein n=1 Tax=Favolaschia claudopus TaxID=2862362 RepID=A0AAW0AS78_9AGAR
MISSLLFLKARAIAFSLIIFTCLVWIVLLSVYMYIGWDTLSDPAEHPIIALMLFIDAMTMVVLLVLLVLPFREWLDAARFFFLMIAQTGVAIAFAYWNPKFRCPTSNPDSEGVCRLLNVYILIASWVIPTLLVFYACGLAYAMKRCSRPPPMMERDSILPIMRPSYSRTQSYSSVTRGPPEEQRKHISGLFPEIQRKHGSELSNSSTGSLSKPPPAFFL